MKGIPATLFALITAVAVLGAAGFVVMEVQQREADANTVATLSGAFNEVQRRPAKLLMFENASQGQSLFEQDVIKTGATARATIAFLQGMVLNIDPSSLIVIIPPRVDESGQQIQEVIVEAGGISAVAPAGGNRVITIYDKNRKVVAKLVPTAGTGAALKYRFRAGKDGGGQVSILAGSARVEAGGSSVTVQAGQSVEISDAGTGKVRNLPPFPRSLSPGVDARLVLTEEARSAEISWEAVPVARSYHLQIGRTFGFDRLSVDRTVTGTSFEYPAPRRGTWFWRVSSVDANQLEGEFGFARRFSVLGVPSDPEPVAEPSVPAVEEPPVVAELPEEFAREEGFELKGKVLGKGLQVSKKGGPFKNAAGLVKLRVDDVLRAQRGTGVRIGKGAVLGLAADTTTKITRGGRRSGRRVVFLALSDGALTTDLSGKSAALASIYVEVMGARVTVTGTGAVGARARTERLGNSVRVVAERGVIEVQSGGITVKVGAGYAVEFASGAPPGELRKLPNPPTLKKPRAGYRFLTLDSPPPIDFSWGAVEGADTYHLVVASDAAGAAVVYDDLIRGTTFTYGALRPGKYYWTVRAMSGGVEGPSATFRALSVYKDTKPPVVTIGSPEDGASVTTRSITITGTTEPDARLKIDGDEVPLGPGGQFSQRVTLQLGINQIVIEAVDKANNVTFKNLKVRRE